MRVAVTLLVAVLLLAGCGSSGHSYVLKFVNRNAERHFTDLGPRGPSPGDVREASVDLYVGSKKVGTRDLICVVTDTKDASQAGHFAVCTGVANLFGRGEISETGLTVLTDASQTASVPLADEDQRAIVGGTGEFEGAQGVLTIVPGSGAAPTTNIFRFRTP